MIQQIVANNIVLKKFSKIDIFEIDLGKNLTGGATSSKKKDMSIKISDDFIQRYRHNTNNLLFKYGNIGSLKFYTDSTLSNNELIAFDGDNIYEIEIDDVQMLTNSPRTYLSNLIEKISNVNSDKNEDVDEIKNIIISSKPEDTEVPDISLPYDQYVEKLIKRRNSIDNG